MKNTNPKATKTVYPIICQIVNVIPHQFIAEAAKAHKVQSRTFTPKSHVAAMLYCQVSKTESLNSIRDGQGPLLEDVQLPHRHRPGFRAQGAQRLLLQGEGAHVRRRLIHDQADHEQLRLGEAPPREGRRKAPCPAT